MIKERWCETHGWVESKYWHVGRTKLLHCSICGDLLTNEYREVADE